MNTYGKEKQAFLFIIDFLQQKPVVIPLSEIDVTEIEFEIPAISIRKVDFSENREIDILNGNYSLKTYLSQFEKVISHIKRGDSFLVNLTCQTNISLNNELKTVFNRAEAKGSWLTE